MFYKTMLLQERLFTTREFNQLATTIFSPEERVELLDGRIVTMTKRQPQHMCCVNELSEWLFANVTKQAFISVQNSVELSDYSEPQPDIALLKRKRDNYRYQLPTAEDILLLIEVSDTSETLDREVKIPLYAREGVAEVWIVSLTSCVVDVFRQPVNGVYQSITRFAIHDSVPIPFAEALMIPVDVFIGPAE